MYISILISQFIPPQLFHLVSICLFSMTVNRFFKSILLFILEINTEFILSIQINLFYKFKLMKVACYQNS